MVEKIRERILTEDTITELVTLVAEEIDAMAGELSGRLVGDRPAGHRHVCGGSVMTMKGEPVPAEGLDHIKALEKWLEQYSNDVMVRSKLVEMPRWPT